jgi:CRISPR-associated helicase cas3
MDVSKLMRSFAAKTNPNDSAQWLPLWMHARDTAGIMEKLWKHWLPAAVRREICGGSEEALQENEALFQKVCVFLGMAHDIGKATAVFQARILEMLPEVRERLAEEGLEIPSDAESKRIFNVPHALAGQVILRDLHVEEGICEIVGAHHGRPAECSELKIKSEDKLCWDSFEYWGTIWSEFLSYAVRMSGLNCVEELPELSITQQVLLSGLIIMADWIASNQFYFPTISVDELGSEKVYPKRVQAAWKKLELPEYRTAGALGMGEESFQDRFGFSPNKLQAAVMDVAENVGEPGLLIIEAQMGVGKTEAALAASEIFAGICGSGGLFFGLPTQATANGIFPRILDWAKKQLEQGQKFSLILKHSKADLNPDYAKLLEEMKTQFEGEAQIDCEDDAQLVVHSFFRGRKQALLSDFVVATVDQILMAALKQKHLMLRHLGMAGKIVIIDEVHAYDAYMSVYLEQALCWLGAYHVPVILLSATLPAEQRVSFVNAYLSNRDGSSQEEVKEWKEARGYPLLTWTDENKICQRELQLQGNTRNVLIKRVKESARIDILREKLMDGGCAIVILSTIRRAQEFAKEVRAQMPEAEIILLHSAFLMPDRAARERELLQKLGKRSTKAERDYLIVIGTSVLEQSLDIDGDVMFIDLCPMDLLLQRLGRLHRHAIHDSMRPEQLKAAQCYVIEPDEDAFESGTSRIYGDYLLMRTKKRLPDHITLPTDIPNLVQDCYGTWDPQFAGEEVSIYQKAGEKEIKKKLKRTGAQTYVLGDPDESLTGWLGNVKSDFSEGKAMAQVRDAENSIEVLLFIKHEDEIRYLPWQQEGESLPLDRIPSKEEKRKILQQCVKLPGALCKTWKIDMTLKELNQIRQWVLAGEWKQDAELREESFLLLDENLETNFAGFHLRYTKAEGLICEKGEGDDRT